MSITKPRIRTWIASCRRYIRLYVLIAVFVVCDVAIATVVEASGDLAGGILLGVVFSQVVLIAVCTALGPFSVFRRMATGVALASMLGLVLVACISNSGGGDAEWLWFLIVVSQWFAIQISLSIVRLCFGWRLAHADKGITRSGRSDMQFGIRQLLAWTALVAVVLGIGRWLLPADILGGGPPEEALVIFCVLTLFTCLLAWPVIWASLSRNWLPIWLIAAAACCVALTIAEIATFQAAMGRGGDLAIFWIMNPLQALAASLGLLVLRTSGFRLVRVHRQDHLHRHNAVEA